MYQPIRLLKPAVCALFVGVLVGCSGGGGGSSPGTGGGSGGGSGSPSTPSTTANTIVDEAAAVRFLSRSTFGGTKSEIAAMVNRDAADWLATEFSRPASLTLNNVLAEADSSGDIPARTISNQYWDQVLTAPDQLRQRMAFALSQIFVYSDASDSDQAQRAFYQDILIRNAFGNYRDLLEEITYSPAMGKYLTYWRNRKGDPATGRMPDENYAREILQLFSIGLVELNMDGTPRVGDIETYTNDDIVGLARVFTGLSSKGPRFTQRDRDSDYNPMVMFDDEHSQLEKSFLGTTIPPNTNGEESIRQALDTIFAHPNVAPFISRQLIQRFTASDPDPAYVARVAAAFEAGQYVSASGRSFGTGDRGDLQATLAAVLLEASLFDETGDTNVQVRKGKVREPILRFTHYVRAFGTQNINSANEKDLRDTRDPAVALGQHPFRSPSVFNFYRPGYIAPNTRTGDLGMTAPEFQLVNESTAVGYNSFMTEFAFNVSTRSDSGLNTFEPNYTVEVGLVDTPADLVDHLNVLLTAGRMPPEERAEIVSIVEALPIRTSSSAQEAEDRLRRVHTAVTLVLNSPSYAITW